MSTTYAPFVYVKFVPENIFRGKHFSMFGGDGSGLAMAIMAM